MLYIISVKVLINNFWYTASNRRKFVIDESYITHYAFHTREAAEAYVKEARKEFVKADLKARAETGKRIDYIRCYKVEEIFA